MALRHHRPWQPAPLDRALAARFGPDSAWIVREEGVLVVTESPSPVSTPVLSLIQAVWERDRDQAHAILRTRLRTTAEPAPLDRASVQVAAKKLAYVSPQPGCAELPALELSPWVARARAKSLASVFDPGVSVVDNPWILENWLPAPSEGPLAQRDRALVAALLDGRGRLLLAARNTAGANRTLHAELNLVHAWWARTGERLPEGCRLLTTLRPCRMCAALVVRAAAGPLSVVYLHDDPGPLAQGTALAQLGWEHPG